MGFRYLPSEKPLNQLSQQHFGHFQPFLFASTSHLTNSIFGWDVPPRRFSKGNVCSATSTFSDLSLFAAKFSSTMQKSSTVLCKRLLAKKTFNGLMPFSTYDHLRLKLWLKLWLVLEPIKFLQPHFLNATFENVISSNPRRVAEFARRKKTFGALDF